MAKKIPQPIPGALLVPRLLAYELAKACEEEEMQSIIAVVVDSDGSLYIRISDGVMASDIAFAGTILHKEAVETAMNTSLHLRDEEDEE